MRVARVTVQLSLPDLEEGDGQDRWWSLPEATRGEVMTLLAALIARGVVIESEAGSTGLGQGMDAEQGAGDE